ncbi:hypothetical protein [Nannocystis pusilla]|uniref:hypothetical protein n=1 Tax=Nannocystis pusilla TaxID=889268 RepID=UPI003B815D01
MTFAGTSSRSSAMQARAAPPAARRLRAEAAGRQRDRRRHQQHHDLDRPRDHDGPCDHHRTCDLDRLDGRQQRCERRSDDRQARPAAGARHVAAAPAARLRSAPDVPADAHCEVLEHRSSQFIYACLEGADPEACPDAAAATVLDLLNGCSLCVGVVGDAMCGPDPRRLDACCYWSFDLTYACPFP